MDSSEQSSTSLSDNIEINIINDVPMVWDTNSIILLRTKLHLLGSLLGSYPRCPLQNKIHSKPLILSNQEMALLISKDIGKHYKLDLQNKDLSNDVIKEFNRKRSALHLEQIHEFKREQTAKRRKYCNKNEENITDAVVGSSLTDASDKPEKSVTTDDSYTVTLSDKDLEYYADSTWVKIDSICCDKNLKTLLNKIELNQLISDVTIQPRYLVFKSLWDAGFYVSCGDKFGADFLIYDDDPVLCHAVALVMINIYDKTPSNSQVHRWGRLSNSVKKTLILANVNPTCSSVTFQALSAYKSPKTSLTSKPTGVETQCSSSESPKVKVEIE